MIAWLAALVCYGLGAWAAWPLPAGRFTLALVGLLWAGVIYGRLILHRRSQP